MATRFLVRGWRKRLADAQAQAHRELTNAAMAEDWASVRALTMRCMEIERMGALAEEVERLTEA